MRIAVNTRFLLARKLEGIGRFTLETVKRMVAAHPEDEFIFFFDRPYDPAFVFGPNVTPVVLFPPTRHVLLILAWFDGAVRRALRRYKPDVFLSPDGFMPLYAKVKTAIVCHDVAYLHQPEHISPMTLWFYRKFMPRYLRRADRIATVSEFNRQDIARHMHIPAASIAVVYNACSDHFKPLDEEAKKTVREKYAGGHDYFLYVGAVQPRKNIHRLIAAFDRFRETTGAPVKLLIAGRFAWQTGEVKAAFEQARHRHDILFAGYVPEEDLPALMGAALALTYVSLFEGFGLPLVEAMACEVPILTSAVTSMPEVAGTAALLVDPRSVEAIAGGMARLWAEPALRESLVAAGRIERQRFDWQRSADQLYEILRQLSAQQDRTD